MFFERVQGNDVYNAALNPPFAYQPSANNVYFSNPFTSALTGATTTQSFPSTMTNIKYNYPPPGTADFSLGVQRELAPSVIAVVQYVGSIGWDQNDDRQINTLPLADASNSANPYDNREGVANGSLNANLYRNYPGFSSINQEENETNFDYHSLQAGVRFENRHGLTTQLAYTWSHNISEVSNDLNGLSNPYNAKYDRGSDTSFDRRHIFNASYVYAFPWFANSSSLLAHELLGGWQISGVTVAEEGVPLYVTYTGSDVVGLGCCFTNRPNQVSKVTYPRRSAHGSAPARTRIRLLRGRAARIKALAAPEGTRPWDRESSTGICLCSRAFPLLLTKDRESSFDSSPLIPSTTWISKASILGPTTRTSERSPTTTVRARWSLAASSSSDLWSLPPGAAGTSPAAPFFRFLRRLRYTSGVDENANGENV